MIIKSCVFCHKQYRARKNKQQYCNKDCARQNRVRLATVDCAYCDSSITRPQNKLKASKSGLNFCNRICKEKAQRIGGMKEIQPSHYGEGVHSYKERAFREHGRICNICGNEGSWQGKPLVLDVHHIDGNRKNGKITNLRVLCPNCHRQEEMQKWAV